MAQPLAQFPISVPHGLTHQCSKKLTPGPKAWRSLDTPSGPRMSQENL